MGRPRKTIIETCTGPECDRPVYGHGLCNTHWQQRRNYNGRPLTPIRAIRDAHARDDQGRKQCSKCEGWKPEGDFYASKGPADGLAPECKACRLIRQQEGRFNLEPGAYQRMLAEQGGGCAICGGLEDDGRALAFDHDHACCPGKGSCGKCVRQLLCGRCNRAIGLLNDSPERLEAAAAYLRRHQP